MAKNPKITAGLNCINQYTASSVLIIKRKGNANPKKAGIQNRSGEMYLALTAISKLTIIK
jgi:hypothetical protein